MQLLYATLIQLTVQNGGNLFEHRKTTCWTQYALTLRCTAQPGSPEVKGEQSLGIDVEEFYTRVSFDPIDILIIVFTGAA